MFNNKTLLDFDKITEFKFKTYSTICLGYNMRYTVEPAIVVTFNRSLQDFPYYNLPVYSGHLYITAILTSPLGARFVPRGLQWK